MAPSCCGALMSALRVRAAAPGAPGTSARLGRVTPFRESRRGMADLVIRARRAFVDGALVPATVVVEGGRIREVRDADDRTVAPVELGDDEVLLPGLVDTHVHVNEPGRTEWEGFASATRAALAGGVTTIVDMPLNSIPPTVDPTALEIKHRAAEGAVAVDTGFWGGAVPASLG